MSKQPKPPAQHWRVATMAPKVNRWVPCEPTTAAPYVFLEGRFVGNEEKFSSYPGALKSILALQEASPKKRLTVAVSLKLDSAYGLRIWLNGSDGVWFRQSTHVANTLLEDSKFSAFVDRLLAAVKQ